MNTDITGIYSKCAGMNGEFDSIYHQQAAKFLLTHYLTKRYKQIQRLEQIPSNERPMLERSNLFVSFRQ